MRGFVAILVAWLIVGVARADEVDDVRPWFVRVVAVHAGEDLETQKKKEECGSGLVLRGKGGAAWLLTARHVLGHSPEKLWIKFSSGEEAEIPFRDGLKHESLAWPAVTSGDMALFPLGPIEGLPDRPDPKIDQVDEWHLGGRFTVTGLPPKQRKECANPEPSQGIEVPVQEPIKDETLGEYIPVGSVWGGGASGSPVLIARSGGVAGIYVGAKGETTPRVLWLGSTAGIKLVELARTAGIPVERFSGTEGARFSMALGVLSALVFAPDQEPSARPEFDPTFSMRMSLPFGKRLWGFEEFELGFDLAWRYAPKEQLRYRLVGPNEIELEEESAPYHAFAFPFSIGVGHSFRGPGVRAAFGPVVECPFGTCPAPLLGSRKAGMTLALRATFLGKGFFRFVKPVLGARLDWVPNRLFGYENVFDDPTRATPSLIRRYAIEAGFEFGGAVWRKML